MVMISLVSLSHCKQLESWNGIIEPFCRCVIERYFQRGKDTVSYIFLKINACYLEFQCSYSHGFPKSITQRDCFLCGFWNYSRFGFAVCVLLQIILRGLLQCLKYIFAYTVEGFMEFKLYRFYFKSFLMKAVFCFFCIFFFFFFFKFYLFSFLFVFKVLL